MTTRIAIGETTSVSCVTIDATSATAFLVAIDQVRETHPRELEVLAALGVFGGDVRDRVGGSPS